MQELVSRYAKGERHFANAKLHGADLRDLTFEFASFANADFTGAKIAGCNFDDCVLASADASGSVLEKVQFQQI